MIGLIAEMNLEAINFRFPVTGVLSKVPPGPSTYDFRIFNGNWPFWGSESSHLFTFLSYGGQTLLLAVKMPSSCTFLGTQFETFHTLDHKEI